MRMNKTLIWIMLFAFIASVATVGFADSRDLTYKSIKELKDINPEDLAADDTMLVYDDSTEDVKNIPMGSLLSNRAGASSMASSSTNILPADIPYIVLRKYIGGDGGLDETAGGTHLQDGIAGQVLVLVAAAVDTDGSWIVTPDTSLTIDTLTFDAAGETTTLLYVDDTIGWIVIGSTGTTIALEIV